MLVYEWSICLCHDISFAYNSCFSNRNYTYNTNKLNKVAQICVNLFNFVEMEAHKHTDCDTQYEENQLCAYVHLTMINHSKISVIALSSRRLFGIRHHLHQKQCEGVLLLSVLLH